jgi:transmembrane sensor
MEFPKEPLNSQIIAEASEWLVEFETGEDDADARRRFDGWLRRSPEHVRAYLSLLPLWKQSALARFKHDSGPQSLIAFARSEDNVVPLSTAEPMKHRLAARWRMPLAVAAGTLLAISGALFVWREIGPTYVTGVGEHRSVILPDGSIVELNARSRIRARFSERQRSIDLMEGQALFDAAPDAARPFVVNIDGLRVRAVGTQFDVNKRANGTVVTVVEGRVSVLPSSSAENAAHPTEGSLISAGEQMTLTAQAARKTLQARPADLAAAMAWTQRRLVFDASLLAEVVEEFNRYNTRPLVIEDSALDRFPITGSFSSTNPSSLIRFLQAQPGIHVIATDDEIRIAARR